MRNPFKMLGRKLLAPLEVFFEIPHDRQELPIRLVASIHPALPNLLAKLQTHTIFKSRRISSQVPFNPQLLSLNGQDISRIVNEVKAKGFSIVSNAIPASVIQDLTKAVLDAQVVERTTKSTPYSGLISGRPHSIGRYDIDCAELLRNNVVRNFAFSDDWKVLGERLLDQKVVWDGVDSWWMYPSTPESASFNAQAFHSDRERLAFIKFFVYLTDIDLTTGPHVYASGTHRKRPLSLRGDRRYSDAELAAKKIEMISICGKAGTIIVANTQGLHKGVAPFEDKGGRLLFQIQIANSLMGFERYIDPSIATEPEVLSALKSDPDYFQVLDLQGK